MVAGCLALQPPLPVGSNCQGSSWWGGGWWGCGFCGVPVGGRAPWLAGLSVLRWLVCLCCSFRLGLSFLGGLVFGLGRWCPLMPLGTFGPWWPGVWSFCGWLVRRRLGAWCFVLGAAALWGLGLFWQPGSSVAGLWMPGCRRCLGAWCLAFGSGAPGGSWLRFGGALLVGPCGVVWGR